MMNIETNPIALSIAEVNWIRPPHIVPSQLKTLMAEGRAISIVESMNVAPSAGFMPDWNMWWPQTMKPRPAIAPSREDHRLVAEQGLAGERRDDVRDDPHRREDHDVDGRVRVEPEQVLPQERLAAADDRGPVGDRPVGRAEEVGAGRPVEQLHHQGRGQHRQGERLEDRRDEHRPDRHRHPEHLHPGRPEHQDRRDVVDRPHQGRHAREQDGDQPPGLPVQRTRRRPPRVRQGRVARPARLRRSRPRRGVQFIATNANGMHQYDSMFSLGNAMSRAPIISGIVKLPNAPARIGMMTRKIITDPCIVNSLL